MGNGEFTIVISRRKKIYAPQEAVITSSIDLVLLFMITYADFTFDPLLGYLSSYDKDTSNVMKVKDYKKGV